MSLDKIFLDFERRVPWPTMIEILRAENLPIGRGWKETSEKASIYLSNHEKSPELIRSLFKCYEEHLRVGEKAVKAFSSDREILQKIADNLSEYKVRDNVFKETYPLSLSREKLEEVSSLPILVDIKKNDNSFAAIYCTKRFLKYQKSLDRSSLTEEARQTIGKFAEIVAIENEVRQCFDLIVIHPDKELIEVRIDISDDISTENRFLAFRRIIDQFNSLLDEVGIKRKIFVSPINFFPLIDRIYESQEEGRVCEMSFTTDGSSIKQEKMRRKNTDLRLEAYHRAGKKAVDHIVPYRLAIQWSKDKYQDIQAEPELYLPGNLRTLSNIEQRLEEVLIRKCSCQSDYSFVFNKIELYLNSENNGK